MENHVRKISMMYQQKEKECNSIEIMSLMRLYTTIVSLLQYLHRHFVHICNAMHYILLFADCVFVLFTPCRNHAIDFLFVKFCNIWPSFVCSSSSSFLSSYSFSSLLLPHIASEYSLSSYD